MKTICGVYGIFNTWDSKVLIGSSVNVKRRWMNHRSTVTAGTHRNLYFQRAWKKYGGSFFEFRVLEECPVDMLLIREDAWMKYYRSLERDFGYNLCSAERHVPTPEVQAKRSAALRGRTHSEETKAKMRAAQQNRSLEWRQNIAAAKRGVRNPMYGKKVCHSSETRNRISEKVNESHVRRRQQGVLIKNQWGEAPYRSCWNNLLK